MLRQVAGPVPNKPYVSVDVKHHDYFAASIRGQRRREECSSLLSLGSFIVSGSQNNLRILL